MIILKWSPPIREIWKKSESWAKENEILKNFIEQGSQSSVSLEVKSTSFQLGALMFHLLFLFIGFPTQVGTRGGMHNEGVPLNWNVMPILVAAQCY